MSKRLLAHLRGAVNASGSSAIYKVALLNPMTGTFYRLFMIEISVKSIEVRDALAWRNIIMIRYIKVTTTSCCEDRI